MENFDDDDREDQPAWIKEPLTGYDIASINQGGCASGAYMPACNYSDAIATMSEHGDDVLEFIEESLGELPSPPDGISWSGLASFYLSSAVELFCSAHEDLADWENERPVFKTEGNE